MIYLLIIESICLIVAVFSYEKAIRNMKASHKEVIEKARIENLDVWERYDNAEARHMEIEAGLREQIQALAQQLATLRVEKGANPEQERFEKTPKPAEPYSQQLTDFLLGIQYEGARQMVEEDIDRLRNMNYSDEQIYDIISKAE